MSNFVQMDIFFFITSVIALIFLFGVTVVGVYIILIVRKVKKIIKEIELFVEEVTTAGLDSIEVIKSKIEDILNKGGIMERVIATALGTILAKSFKNHGKIKKDAQKK